MKRLFVSWSKLATSIGLSFTEQNMFKDRFDLTL